MNLIVNDVLQADQEINSSSNNLNCSHQLVNPLICLQLLTQQY